MMATSRHSLDSTLAEIFERCGPRLVVAAPLGLGKPHRLLNAIYDAVGVRIKDLPITAEKVYRALKERQS